MVVTKSRKRRGRRIIEDRERNGVTNCKRCKKKLSLCAKDNQHHYYCDTCWSHVKMHSDEMEHY